jgi:hypothetical protein
MKAEMQKADGKELPAYRIVLSLHEEHHASKRGAPCEMNRLAYLVVAQAMPYLAAKKYVRMAQK